MLKCILFLLSEYYYEIATDRMDEICGKLRGYTANIILRKVTEAYEEFNSAETLVITDDAKTVEKLLNEKWYVVVLYHEKNKDECFPAVRYGVEDLFQLEYRSYEEAYKRLAGLPWNILETDRLMVRESTVEDVDEFYRIYSEPSITRYMEGLYKEREAELAYMKAYIDQVYGFYGYGLWTVILKKTGQIIGRAGLSVREGCCLPELGFMIDVAHQNRGYGFEVCTAILAYAREELAFEKVQALVNKENFTSLRLLNKLGFEFDSNVIVSNCDYKLFTKKI